MKKRVSKIIYIALIVILAGVFLFCAGSLIKYFWESQKSKAVYNDISSQVDDVRPTIPIPSGVMSDDDAPVVIPEPEFVTITDPKTGQQMQILPEYADAYLMNTDMVGWIRIPDTSISYPVVQRKDTKDYYLHRNFLGEYDSHGCIYIDERCDPLKPSDNLTLYGHRMKDNTMFGYLGLYVDKSYYEAHPYIQYDTLTERHLYQIVAVFTTTASIGEGFSYHEFVDAADTAAFNSFISTCKRLALYETGISATYGDKLITLSTCEYSQENGRLVVVAKRVSVTENQE